MACSRCRQCIDSLRPDLTPSTELSDRGDSRGFSVHALRVCRGMRTGDTEVRPAGSGCQADLCPFRIQVDGFSGLLGAFFRCFTSRSVQLARQILQEVALSCST